MLSLFKKEPCIACQVYKELAQAKDAELARLNDLLNQERQARQTLEDRLLRFMRVIPSEQGTQAINDQQRINSRIDWPNEKARLEREAAQVQPETEKKRIYWSNKVEKDAPKLQEELKVDEQAS